jgi:hypothetical protein
MPQCLKTSRVGAPCQDSPRHERPEGPGLDAGTRLVGCMPGMKAKAGVCTMSTSLLALAVIAIFPRFYPTAYTRYA